MALNWLLPYPLKPPSPLHPRRPASALRRDPNPWLAVCDPCQQAEEGDGLGKEMAAVAQLVFAEVGIQWDAGASSRFEHAFAATLMQAEGGDRRTVPPEEAAALAVMVARQLC